MAARYILSWKAKYEASRRLEQSQRYMEVLTGLLGSESVDPETMKWVVCQAAEAINDATSYINEAPVDPCIGLE